MNLPSLFHFNSKKNRHLSIQLPYGDLTKDYNVFPDFSRPHRDFICPVTLSLLEESSLADIKMRIEKNEHIDMPNDIRVWNPKTPEEIVAWVELPSDTPNKSHFYIRINFELLKNQKKCHTLNISIPSLSKNFKIHFIFYPKKTFISFYDILNGNNNMIQLEEVFRLMNKENKNLNMITRPFLEEVRKQNVTTLEEYITLQKSAEYDCELIQWLTTFKEYDDYQENLKNEEDENLSSSIALLPQEKLEPAFKSTAPLPPFLPEKIKKTGSTLPFTEDDVDDVLDKNSESSEKRLSPKHGEICLDPFDPESFEEHPSFSTMLISPCTTPLFPEYNKISVKLESPEKLFPSFTRPISTGTISPLREYDKTYLDSFGDDKMLKKNEREMLDTKELKNICENFLLLLNASEPDLAKEASKFVRNFCIQHTTKNEIFLNAFKKVYDKNFPLPEETHRNKRRCVPTSSNQNLEKYLESLADHFVNIFTNGNNKHYIDRVTNFIGNYVNDVHATNCFKKNLKQKFPHKKLNIDTQCSPVNLYPSQQNYISNQHTLFAHKNIHSQSNETQDQYNNDNNDNVKITS